MQDEFHYEEDVRGGNHLLWGNAAFAFAHVWRMRSRNMDGVVPFEAWQAGGL